MVSKKAQVLLWALKGPGLVRLVSVTSLFEPSGAGSTEPRFSPKNQSQKLFFVLTCSELSKLGQKSGPILENKLI